MKKAPARKGICKTKHLVVAARSWYAQKMDPPLTLGNNRFHILHKLGDGGMGVVYAAEDTLLGTRVALKRLKDANLESLIYLKNEFRSLQELQHPNLITFVELFENEGEWFFTMELVEGEDFLTYVRTEPAMPHTPHESEQAKTITTPGEEGLFPVSLESTADEKAKKAAATRKKRFPSYDEGRLRSALGQLVKGLMALHSIGLIHRDIKPGNIMVDTAGRLVLMDLGLATDSSLSPGELASLFPVGTAAYMSPEQAASQPLAFASDWYSVGVLLFQALTGHLPFDGSFSTIVFQKQGREAPLPSEFVIGIPDDLHDLCCELLLFDPQKRPSGQQILARLQGEAAAPAVTLEKSLSHSHLFTGRDTEKAQLTQFYEEYISGKDRAVLVHGASGLGKSELIRQFLQTQVRGQEKTIILSARCYETESVSYKAFDPVIDELSQYLSRMEASALRPFLPADAGLLARVFPVLSRVKSIESSVASDDNITSLPEFRAGVFEVLRELLYRLAKRYAIVIYIDNFQWADEDSLRLFKALMHPPYSPHIFFIISQRTNADAKTARHEVAETLGRLPVKARALEVGPLSTAETMALAQKVLSLELRSEQVTRGVLRDLAEESAGHPLFVQELARYLTSQSATKRKGEMPTLDDVLWERVHNLEALPQKIVQIASLSGVPITVGVLSKILEIPAGQCIRYVNQLRVLTLLAASGLHNDRRVEPYHDRVREAVAHRLPAEQAKQLHLTLAHSFKESMAGSSHIIAYHFASGGRTDMARIHYLQAAKQANAAFAFERESLFLQKALELWPDSPLSTDKRRRAVVYDLARALAHSGRGRQAALTYISLEEGALSAEQLQLRRMAGGILLRSGHVSEGLTVMEKALKTLRVRLPRTSWSTLVSLLWNRFRLRLRGLRFVERDESEHSKATLERLDIFNSLADGMGTADHLLGADLSTRWIMEALRVGEPKRVLTALLREANYVAAAGHGGSLYHRRIMESISELMERVEVPSGRGWVLGSEAYQAYMGGHWRVAYDKASEGIAAFTPTNSSYWESTILHFVLLWSSFYLGDLTAMEQLTRPNLHDAMDRGDMLGASGNILGLNTIVYLKAKGPEKARNAAHWVISKWSTSKYHLQHYWYLLANQLIDYYSGDAQHAMEKLRDGWGPLKRSRLLLLPSIRHEALYLRGRSFLTYAAQTEGSSRTRAIKRGLKDAKRLENGRMEWPKALGRVLRAESLLRTGHEELGVALLKEICIDLKGLEMMLYLAAVRHKLGGIIGGDEGRRLRALALHFFDKHNISEEEAARFTRMLIP